MAKWILFRYTLYETGFYSTYASLVILVTLSICFIAYSIMIYDIDMQVTVCIFFAQLIECWSTMNQTL